MRPESTNKRNALGAHKAFCWCMLVFHLPHPVLLHISVHIPSPELSESKQLKIAHVIVFIGPWFWSSFSDEGKPTLTFTSLAERLCAVQNTAAKKSSILILWLQRCFSLEASNYREIWKSSSGCYLCFVLKMPFCKSINPDQPNGAL